MGVYDTQQPTLVDSALNVAKHEALFTVDKSVPQGHVYSVSSVQWYPVDTGLFVTGSYDKNINLWDTNTHQVSKGSSALSLGVVGEVEIIFDCFVYEFSREEEEKLF